MWRTAKIVTSIVASIITTPKTCTRLSRLILPSWIPEYQRCGQLSYLIVCAFWVHGQLEFSRFSSFTLLFEKSCQSFFEVLLIVIVVAVLNEVYFAILYEEEPWHPFYVIE